MEAIPEIVITPEDEEVRIFLLENLKELPVKHIQGPPSAMTENNILYMVVDCAGKQTKYGGRTVLVPTAGDAAEDLFYFIKRQVKPEISTIVWRRPIYIDRRSYKKDFEEVWTGAARFAVEI